MNKELSIDTLIFEENGQYHAFSPHLELCFSGAERTEARDYLKDGVKAQLDYWQEKCMLSDKIEQLGLAADTPKERKNAVDKDVQVPLHFFNMKPTLEKISLTVTV